jgi:dynein heavy chain
MLRERYMRPRHWEKLQKHLGTILDYESETFTLEEIFKLNLLSSAESVREVCDVAREEFKIESALAGISSKWEGEEGGPKGLELVMEEHRAGYYKVKKVEEIFSTLEDHMGILSAQKTTLFYESFKGEIEYWENLL